MTPTLQGSSPRTAQGRRPQPEKRSDVLCRVKYSNTLPDIPSNTKFLAYAFSKRFFFYEETDLQTKWHHDLLTEHDLGVTIDLIDPNTYAPPNEDVPLHPSDEKLLEEEHITPADSKRSKLHSMVIPWVKKTEYIATEFSRYGQSGVNTETKVGYNVKKMSNERSVYMDRESQIEAINRTFEDAQKPISQHYSKANVTPVEVFPVYPDFELWKYPFAQVLFDNEPAPMSQAEEMSQAMIRGVMDESGEQFVAYFMPTEETLKKRKEDAENHVDYQDEVEYDYKMTREYNWSVKNKASSGYEENYFFVIKDGCVFYNELETRVRLTKRRHKPGMAPNNSKLVVKHRVLNESEHRQQQLRMSQLAPPQEESDEDADDEEEDDDENENKEDQKDDDDVDDKKTSSPARTSGLASKARSKSRSASRSRSRSRSHSSSRSSSSGAKSGSASRSGSEERKSASGKGSSHSGSQSSSRSGSASESETEQNQKGDKKQIFGSSESDSD